MRMVAILLATLSLSVVPVLNAASRMLELQAESAVTLDVTAFNGSIRVREIAGLKVVKIWARVRTREREDLDSIAIRVKTVDAVLRIRAVNTRKLPDTGVALDIHTPPAGLLRADTRNGPIRIEGFGGDMNVRTTNAKLNISNAGGVVMARTSNASVRVTMSAAAVGPVEIWTSNEHAHFTPGESFVGVIAIQTSNGGVTTDGLTGVTRIAVDTEGGEIQIGSEQQVRARVRTTNSRVHIGL